MLVRLDGAVWVRRDGFGLGVGVGRRELLVPSISFQCNSSG